MKLSPKQQAFCEFYIECGNATAAYRKAYPKSIKWKDKTVNEAASRLLKNSKVYARVRELQREASKRNELTVDDLIQELKGILFFNPKDLYNEDGCLKPINDLPDEVAACIASLDIEENHFGEGVQRKAKVKFHSKLDAIEKLAKHLGFYEKDNRSKEEHKAVIILPHNGRDDLTN